MEMFVNGIRIFYTDSGKPDGVPVVLIHGFPFSHAMWAQQSEVLKSGYRVISYDLRGFGESSAGDGQFMLEFFVDDLIALLDELKIQTAVICGLSMGGYIALRAIERNPERFSGVVLADTRPDADSNESKLKRAAAIKSVKKDGVKIFTEGFLKAVFLPESISKNSVSVQKIREIIHSNSPLGICGAILALASRTDTSAALAKIIVPTLVMTGERDLLAPPAVAQNMANEIHDAEFHVIPGAAHMSNLENPVEFNRHLLDFLKRKCGQK